MAFDATFVKQIIGQENVSDDDKVTQIMSGYNADLNGLKLKRDELLRETAEKNKQIETFKNSSADFEKQIAELTEQMKKKPTDESTKEFYEAQVNNLNKTHADELARMNDELSKFKMFHLEGLKKDAIQKGIEGLNFVDKNLEKGFIAYAMATNQFTPEEIDGQYIFLNKEHKQISDVLKELATSEVGKSFLANGNSGGGAGSGSTTHKALQVNPFAKGHEDLALQTHLYKTNRTLAIQLAKEAGVDLR